MRVIAGTARGVVLAAPSGHGTRPITDRVKETLFAILADRVPDARVVDLFAGSGAIGIEALSRGAAAVDFVERDRRALDAIRANLERARVVDGASVHAADVDRYLERPDIGPWDLAMLDPPYESRAMVAPLQALVPNLAPGAMVVVKHFWRTELPPVDRLVAIRTRRFGETSLTFLELEAE
jgi:16S rRNA (guanine966-N2)-methyltransferase